MRAVRREGHSTRQWLLAVVELIQGIGRPMPSHDLCPTGAWRRPNTDSGNNDGLSDVSGHRGLRPDKKTRVMEAKNKAQWAEWKTRWGVMLIVFCFSVCCLLVCTDYMYVCVMFFVALIYVCMC